jgi:hypothetical protein
MSDDQHDHGLTVISRREAFKRLLGTAGGVLSGAELVAAQLAPPRNLRIVGPQAAAGSPADLGLHPRTFLTPTTVSQLRSQIAGNAAVKARWQDAVTTFEAGGGYWAANSPNPLTNAFAAFLTCVRRPNDDLGLTWGSSWQTYRTRVVTAMSSWNHTGESGMHALAHGIVYDLLYPDLTDSERTQLHEWIVQLLDVKSKLKWQSDGGHWDDQTSDEHLARVVLSVAAEDWRARAPRALSESLDYAAAHEAMQYGEGLGYAWKDETVANLAPLMSLWILKNAMGLSDADTIDKCLVSFRDTWQHVRQFTIPHPGYASPIQWKQARVNFQAPLVPSYHRGLNVGANMLWALALLPGKVNLTNDGTLSDQPKLANDEASLLGYMRHVMDQTIPGVPPDRVMSRAVTNYKWVYTGAPTPDRGHMQTFLAFAPWLILNVQPRPAMTPEQAGIARVRRWWPGTLNWVTIIGGTWESGVDQSLISYSHRRYYSNNYTAGVAQNGMWQVHRGGPLLIKRGATSHGPVGKQTWAGNGTIGFYDPNNPEFVLGAGLDADRGEIRVAAHTHDHYQDMLNDPTADFGQITSWYADGKVVAITSDLTRSYNSTEVAVNGAPKISAFTREFVSVQRGGDGSDHERIFTYDRIAVLGTGQYHPRYNLCPATNPDIDGVETPYTPPASAVTSVADPKATFKTTGPVRWDYKGATRLIYDSTTQDVPTHGGTKRGGGKVCVTWLQPTGASVAVRKRGGTAMYWDPPIDNKKIDGCPAFGPYGELDGKDGAWNDVNNPASWMFAGLYTVQVMHTAINPDTRFLMACDVMSSGAAPDRAEAVSCDAGSVAARCGGTVVVFSKDASGHRSGSVAIPSGVALVVLANLTPGQRTDLSASGGLTITTGGGVASAGNTAPGVPNRNGRVVVGVSGSGTLAFG